MKSREYTETEESYTPAVWDPNDGSDSQSNNAPISMRLYQDKSLPQRPDLEKLSRDFAKQLADPIIKQVLAKEPSTKYAA